MPRKSSLTNDTLERILESWHNVMMFPLKWKKNTTKVMKIHKRFIEENFYRNENKLILKFYDWRQHFQNKAKIVFYQKKNKEEILIILS